MIYFQRNCISHNHQFLSTRKWKLEEWLKSEYCINLLNPETLVDNLFLIIWCKFYYFWTTCTIEQMDSEKQQMICTALFYLHVKLCHSSWCAREVTGNIHIFPIWFLVFYFELQLKMLLYFLHGNAGEERKRKRGREVTCWLRCHTNCLLVWVVEMLRKQ